MKARPWLTVPGLTVLAVALAWTEAMAQNPQATPPPQQEPQPAFVRYVLGSREVQGILGGEVRSTGNEAMGHIADIIVDGEGNFASRHHRFRRLPGHRQPQDRRRLGRAALRSASQQRYSIASSSAASRSRLHRNTSRANRSSSLEPIGHPRADPLMKPYRRHPSRSRLVRLFVADVQTGFGPFVAVYLTAREMDAGRYRSRPFHVAASWRWSDKFRAAPCWTVGRCGRLVAGIAVALISASAIAYAGWPTLPVSSLRPPSCTRRQVACSAPPSPPSAWVSSARRDRRAARAQRALCLDRRRPCRRASWALSAVSSKTRSVFM